MKYLYLFFPALRVQLFGSVTQRDLYFRHREVAWARGAEDRRPERGSSVRVTAGRGLGIQVVTGGVRSGHGALAVLGKVPPSCSILHTAVKSHGTQVGKKYIFSWIDGLTSFGRS